MVDESIAQALVELAVFLEFSADDIVNPDSAVQALEQLSATLNGADAETKASLSTHFNRISQHYTGEEAQFVRTLAEALGLVDGQG